jgi:hypothetical protein
MKKLYKNPFLSTAILSDILTSDTPSVVTNHITLRKYKILLWHELCTPGTCVFLQQSIVN